MRKLTEAELKKKQALAAARTVITLKHRLAAMAEQNDVLPDLMARIDLAIAGGEPLAIEVPDVRVK